MPKVSVGIVGATGYTGSELVRFLIQHPNIELKAITSESHAGKRFSDVHSFFEGYFDLKLITSKELLAEPPQIVFLALPHGVSMSFAQQFHEAGSVVIDLSGDFRLENPETYVQWYLKEHTWKEGFDRSIYGLPELHRGNIAKSRLIANPGCFPTCSTLALAPLVKHRKINQKSIIIDAKTGTTGAGVKPSNVTHFPNVNDNFKAYGLKSHRHTVEIEEQLGLLGNQEIRVQFTPHLLPVDRGIMATCYATPTNSISEEEVVNLYKEYYQNEPFVLISSSPPDLKRVRGTNFCHIFPTYDKRTNRIIIISVIDNLVKGAAGQAIQNMNLVLGIQENSGLQTIPLQP